ncbi:DMT family transporter [Antarcticirhabdus aurantiaca]|uniref:DMT family transporter n=1 Tax=Antarcticirhabdus aurantiaca TaxID=2606717 RepID=UPI002103CCB3|nr:DMT family transporter [Antarcticirhabdus aurantiaca]
MSKASQPSLAGEGASAPRAPGSIHVLALLPPLFWAGNFVVSGLMRNEIPPLQMSFYRWLLASLFMLPFAAAALAAHRRTLREEAFYLAGLSLIGVTAFNSLVYVALHHTQVVNAAILNSLMPVATFLLAFLLMRTKVTASQALGAGVAFAGALAIVVRGDPGRLLSLEFNAGDLLVVAGLTCWALYTVLVKRRPSRLPPMAFLLATFAMGTVFHVPFVIWEVGTVGGVAFGWRTAAALLFLAIFPSILAYVVWNRSVAALGPGRTAIYMYAMPVFTAALAILFLGEQLRVFHILGLVFIVAGITLVTNPRGSRSSGVRAARPFGGGPSEATDGLGSTTREV